MERISFVVLVLHISLSRPTQAVSKLQVHRWSKVRLDCSEKHVSRTVWYGQKCNELPFIIIAFTGTNHSKLKETFIHGSNPRFKLDWEPKTDSYGLKIENFDDSDQGFYYCSVGEGGYTIIASGYSVTLKEKVNTPTSPSVTAKTTLRLEIHEENRYWQWPIISLIVSGMALWGIYIIQKKPQRKKKTTQTCKIKQQDGVYTTVYFTAC